MAEIRCPLMDKEVDGFECNNSSIEEQVRDSYFITLLKQAYGHQIIIDGQIVGYYMAMHIRYLAIDKRVQHRGIGTIVLRGILAEIIELSKKYPIRIITIDALTEYYDWYKNIGFKDIHGCESDGIVHQMYIDCMTKKETECLEEFCGQYN